MRTGFWFALLAAVLVLYVSGCPAPEEETPETPAVTPSAVETPEQPPVVETPEAPSAGMNQTGAIEALSATSITVNGTAYNIAGTTEWLDADGNPWAVENFNVGDTVLIEGTADETGALNATRIKLETAAGEPGAAVDEEGAAEDETGDAGEDAGEGGEEAPTTP